MNKIFSLLFFVCTPLFFFSQENNYWNAQYGANSSLLGGAVVSTYCDNGSMYYNPATLAFKDSGNISLSANLYKVENLTITNAIGIGLDLTNINYGISPQIVSGNLQVTRKIDVGFIFLTRNDVDFAFGVANKNNYLMQPTYSVPDTLHSYDVVSDFKGNTRITEQWAGLVAGYRINEKFAIGITNFIGYRFQRFSKSINITATGNDDSLYRYNAKFDYSQNVSFDNLNDIIKIGGAYNSKYFDAGLTFTLPSFNIFGIGKANSQWFFANKTPFVNQHYLTYDKETNLHITYKTPLSLALGFCLKFNTTKIFLSGEYFAPIDRYPIYKIKSTLYPTKNSVQFNANDVAVVNKLAKTVINGAMGIEQKLTATIKLLVGFRTDFSAVKSEDIDVNDNDISYAYVNIWHGSFGLKIYNGKKSVTIGLTAAYGRSDNHYQFANVTNPTDVENTAMLGNVSESSDYIYRSIGLVLGFSY